MKMIRNLILLILLLVPLNIYAEIILQECKNEEIKGNFNLILYSNAFVNDPETFIIFDRADDKIKITPYAPEFKYKIFENLPDMDALKISKEILLNPTAVSFIKCSVIKGSSGDIIGYELKPLYFPWIFGILEPLETVYKEDGDRIKIFIRLNPRVERQIYGGGTSDRED